MPRPRRSTRLSAVMHRHATSGHAGDDLLAEQGPAPALDHAELGVDLVGAVEVDVEPDSTSSSSRSGMPSSRASSAVGPRWRERR